eukprot:3373226-Rhodomonas_salina.2
MCFLRTLSRSLPDVSLDSAAASLPAAQYVTPCSFPSLRNPSSCLVELTPPDLFPLVLPPSPCPLDSPPSPASLSLSLCGLQLEPRPMPDSRSCAAMAGTVAHTLCSARFASWAYDDSCLRMQV